MVRGCGLSVPLVIPSYTSILFRVPGLVGRVFGQSHCNFGRDETLLQDMHARHSKFVRELFPKTLTFFSDFVHVITMVRLIW